MSTFTINLQEFQATCSRNAKIIAQRTAMEAFASVVEMTPVDTGRARGAWIPSLDNPSDEVTAIDAFDPIGAETINAVASFIPSFDLGHVAYLTNNLPYISLLEDGSSKQAPAGMVQVTVMNIQNKFESIAREVNP